MEWTDIARSAYRAYVASKGTEEFQFTTQDFDDLSPILRTAWEAAVRQAVFCSQVGDYANSTPHDDYLNEQRWEGWTPPTPIGAGGED